MLVMQ